MSFVVQTKILEHVEMEASERAKIVTKWIEVALACKRLKNFSSLNAIVQGLNTQCISRRTKHAKKTVASWLLLVISSRSMCSVMIQL